MKKKKIETIHRISFGLLNIIELISILNFSSAFPNNENPGYDLKGIIISIILLISTSVVYVSWWKLYTKVFDI